MWRLLTEPSGATYRRLIDYAMGQCLEFCLVLQSPSEASPSELAALDALLPHRTEVQRTYRWPGTRVFGSGPKAGVYWHRCSREAGESLVALSSRLYDWLEPKLPEDLAFVTTNRQGWLITVAHEREAWLADTIDVSDFRAGVPRVTLEHRPDVKPI